MCILYLYGCGLGTLHVATECTLDTNNSVFPGYYLLKCTGDTNFGVRIGTNLGHQIWCPGDTIFFTVYSYICKTHAHVESTKNVVYKAQTEVKR